MDLILEENYPEKNNDNFPQRQRQRQLPTGVCSNNQ